MERMLTTLRDAGVPPPDRVVAADTLFSYVTGFVLQEQAPAPSPALTPDELTSFATRFPLTLAEGGGADADELFVRSLRLQCAGIATLLKPRSRPR
jgi:TetR/AcrR family tetracycline transcriptional repressor